MPSQSTVKNKAYFQNKMVKIWETRIPYPLGSHTPKYGPYKGVSPKVSESHIPLNLAGNYYSCVTLPEMPLRRQDCE